MEIEVTDIAEEDLEGMPESVQETFSSKMKSVRRNLDMGASPGQVFKRLKGNMNPVLQMPLGSDYRAWFLEGKYIPAEGFESGKVYCMSVLTKKDAKDLSREIVNPVSFLQSGL